MHVFMNKQKKSVMIASKYTSKHKLQIYSAVFQKGYPKINFVRQVFVYDMRWTT